MRSAITGVPYLRLVVPPETKTLEVAHYKNGDTCPECGKGNLRVFIVGAAKQPMICTSEKGHYSFIDRLPYREKVSCSLCGILSV